MPESTPEKEQHDTIESPYRISWRRLLKIILPIFVLFFAIAYWFVGIYTPSKIEAPTTIPTPDFQEATQSAKPTTSSAQKDETADWTEYTYNKFKISFKHPNGWYLKESEPSTLIVSQKKDLTLQDNPSISIGKANFYKGRYEDAIKYKVSTSVNSISGSGDEIIRFPNVVVDSESAIVLYEPGKPLPSNPSFRKTVYIKKGDSYYQLWISGDTKQELEKQEKIFNLLIPTFKFLE